MVNGQTENVVLRRSLRLKALQQKPEVCKENHSTSKSLTEFAARSENSEQYT